MPAALLFVSVWEPLHHQHKRDRLPLGERDTLYCHKRKILGIINFLYFKFPSTINIIFGSYIIIRPKNNVDGWSSLVSLSLYHTYVLSIQLYLYPAVRWVTSHCYCPQRAGISLLYVLGIVECMEGK